MLHTLLQPPAAAGFSTMDRTTCAVTEIKHWHSYSRSTLFLLHGHIQTHTLKWCQVLGHSHLRLLIGCVFWQPNLKNRTMSAHQSLSVVAWRAQKCNFNDLSDIFIQFYNCLPYLFIYTVCVFFWITYAYAWLLFVEVICSIVSVKPICCQMPLQSPWKPLQLKPGIWGYFSTYFLHVYFWIFFFL